MTEPLDSRSPLVFIIWTLAFFSIMDWLEVAFLILGLAVLSRLVRGFDTT